MTDETERGAPHRISGGAFSSFCGPSGAADAELHPVEGFGDSGVRHAQMFGDLAQAVPVRERLKIAPTFIAIG